MGMATRFELLPRPRIFVAHQDLRHCTPEQLAQNVLLANHNYPERTTYLASCPDEADPLFALSMRQTAIPAPNTGEKRHGPITVYIHPASGEIVGGADTEHSWIHWVEDFHVYLLAGRSGERWNGIGAATLLVLVLTGVVLWWPGIQRWKRSLIVDFRRGWKRINWDLHNVTGIWTVTFTLMWAMTGIYFAWPKTIAGTINRVSPVVTARYPSTELTAASTSVRPGAGKFDLLTVLREAQKESPKGVLEGCFDGSDPHAIFTVYMARGRLGDYANTDFVYFDQSSGSHLYTWRRGENVTLGDWLLWLTTPLHFGTSWGMAVKIIWACLGMALPLLTITGFFLYWNRYLNRKILKLRKS
jgi:uncharacterized iron-regulated membrane protein